MGRLESQTLLRRSSATDASLRSLTTRFEYDRLDRVIKTTDPRGDIRETVYDANGKIVQQKIHYYGAGRLINRILGNGAQTGYQYDADNRLIQLSNIAANGTAVERLTYQRDAVGNITHINSNTAGKIVDYSYDALYRLRNVDSTDNLEDRSYTYDKVGNRKIKTQNGVTYYHNHGLGNRLLDIRTGSATGPLYRQFTYDNSGRMLQKQDANGEPLYSVNYDGKGRAETIDTPLNGSSEFAYDPNDYRVVKNNKLYHLKGEHLEATYDNAGFLQERYLRGVVIDEIVNGFYYNSGGPIDWVTYTFNHDHLNSVTALTGHSGEIEEQTTYDVFGYPLDLHTLGTDLLFTGREYYRDSQLYCYRARYYDPEIGRFISEDPLGFQAGINFYTYVNNNSVNANDPDGEILNFIVGAGVNVLVGAAIRGGIEALSGGNISDIAAAAFDGQAIAIDAAVGVATSGLGAIAQVRHARSVANAARAEGRVVGNAQSTGTFFHAAASEQQAVRLLNEGAETVFLDRAYSTATGIRGSGALTRPDALGVFDDASVRAVEIATKTVDLGVLASRNGSSICNLGLNGSVDVVETAFSFTSPVLIGGQRTIGAAGLQMNAVGAGVTFGSQAAYQGANAAGGFVLYPNKPNLNQLQAIYAK